MASSSATHGWRCLSPEPPRAIRPPATRVGRAFSMRPISRDQSHSTSPRRGARWASCSTTPSFTGVDWTRGRATSVAASPSKSTPCRVLIRATRTESSIQKFPSLSFPLTRLGRPCSFKMSPTIRKRRSTTVSKRGVRTVRPAPVSSTSKPPGRRHSQRGQPARPGRKTDHRR